MEEGQRRSFNAMPRLTLGAGTHAVQVPTQADTIFVSAVATGLCIGTTSLSAMSATMFAVRSSKVLAKGLSVRAAPVSHPNDMLMQCKALTPARRLPSKSSTNACRVFYVIDLIGGPARTRTWNQTVMSRQL